MPVTKLKGFLDEQGIKYLTINHSLAFTALEIAALAHVSGKELAKTVMVKIDGKMAMAVVPAAHTVDLERLKKAAGARRAELANEHDFRDLFPDCEMGAMPPFGNLYDMETYAADSLAQDEQIAFNAGTHTQLFKLAYRDFARLAHPKVAAISAPR